MVELTDDKGQLESNTIGVFRTAATVKGGRRFSFGSLVVVGDRAGQVGLGHAKANEVPRAIEKAQKSARKAMKRITLKGGTIPHEVNGRFGSASIRLIPASPGTGVVAGATVRAVLEMAGITDCLTKSYGSNNKQNLAKATLEGLLQLRTREETASLRGVTIEKSVVDEMLERGRAYMPAVPIKKEAPAESKPEGKGKPKGRGGKRDAPKKKDQGSQADQASAKDAPPGKSPGTAPAADAAATDAPVKDAGADAPATPDKDAS